MKLAMEGGSKGKKPESRKGAIERIRTLKTQEMGKDGKKQKKKTTESP